MGKKGKKALETRDSERERGAWLASNPPNDPPQTGPARELPDAPRTFYSIFIDALTAAVALIGAIEFGKALNFTLHPTYPFDFLTGNIYDPPRLITIAAFAVVFWFLLSDWAAARLVDVLSPNHPPPGGVRFYLDAGVAVSFLIAFDLAGLEDRRLAGWLSCIFALCALWSWRVGMEEDCDPRARLLCQVYLYTHAIGTFVFAVLE